MSDLVDMFGQYTAGLPSSTLYREWSGITLVAGALERRVWAITGRLKTFPNMFTMLVGAPGTGKGVILATRNLWRDTRDANGGPIFNVGKKSYSKASMMDDLAECGKIYQPVSGPPIKYHSLLIAAEEFPVLFPRFDMEFLSTLSDLWNADDSYTEARRTSVVKKLSIDYPLINLLMGYQPAVMSSTLPAAAWDQGFMRRTVMVWNGERELLDLFEQPPLDQKIEDAMTSRLRELSTLYGHMRWEVDAADHLNQWHLAEGPPRPTHLRLQSYCASRTHIVIKLAIIASTAESCEMVIRLRHVERALDWLLRAERVMPEIFRAMVGDSDGALITELHNYMIGLYARTKPKGVHGKYIWAFLHDRVPSHKINYIVQAMEKSELLVREPNTDFWRPMIGSRAQ